LQHPDVVDWDIEYDNPHYFRVPGVEVDLDQLIGPRKSAKDTKKAIYLEIGNIIDSMNIVDCDFEIAASSFILTPLLP